MTRAQIPKLRKSSNEIDSRVDFSKLLFAGCLVPVCVASVVDVTPILDGSLDNLKK